MDGYFDNAKLCAAVNPSDPKSIADGISTLADEVRVAPQYCIEQARRFNWANIAKELISIYSSAEFEARNGKLSGVCARYIDEDKEETVRGE